MTARITTILLLLLFVLSSCDSITNPLEKSINTEVLVIGGGTSGVAAGLQASRCGAKTIIVEPTPWLGGMLTSAGVSATDGNHGLPSGIWGEFRDHLYELYGGPEAVATGWVSNTLFEPSKGNEIWQQLTDKESLLTKYHGYRLSEIIVENHMVKGAIFEEITTAKRLIIYAKVAIDATELGDAIFLAGAAYRQGQDHQNITLEEWAPLTDNNIIQDLTYTAILQDFGENADKTIQKPVGYDKSVFECLCNEVCEDDIIPCDQMLEYGRLPNNKFMVNWPNNGNDYFANVIDLSYEDREVIYEKAKAKTLAWIYFIQTELGYKNLGLAENEFPTKDLLPFIPYHREGRRIIGEVMLTVNDLLDPYQDKSRPFYESAIAVGDYPLDHHHKENKKAAKEAFPAIPSFSIPYLALIPQKIDGLIAAEKNISVSHLANGATRLQPCVLLIGQAAGAAAALSVSENINPRNLSVSKVQQTLLEAGAWLLPFVDAHPDQWYFESIQKAGVLGLLKGHGVPFKWANQTWIYPDSTMSNLEVQRILNQLKIKIPPPPIDTPTIQTILDIVATHLNVKTDHLKKESWWEEISSQPAFSLENKIKRKELAFLIDKALSLN